MCKCIGQGAINNHNLRPLIQTSAKYKNTETNYSTRPIKIRSIDYSNLNHMRPILRLISSRHQSAHLVNLLRQPKHHICTSKIMATTAPRLEHPGPIHPAKVEKHGVKPSIARPVRIAVYDPRDHEAPAILHEPRQYIVDNAKASAAILISGAGGGVSGPAGTSISLKSLSTLRITNLTKRNIPLPRRQTRHAPVHPLHQTRLPRTRPNKLLFRRRNRRNGLSRRRILLQTFRACWMVLWR